MAGEVYSFNEGSAWVWTGNSTTSALFTYMTDQSVMLVDRNSSARAPYSNQYTFVRIDQMARGTFAQMNSQLNTKALFLNVTAGQLHMHIKELQVGQNVSAGFWLWSGTKMSMRWNSVAGGMSQVSLDASFQTASAY